MESNPGRSLLLVFGQSSVAVTLLWYSTPVIARIHFTSDFFLRSLLTLCLCKRSDVLRIAHSPDLPPEDFEPPSDLPELPESLFGAESPEAGLSELAPFL